MSILQASLFFIPCLCSVSPLPETLPPIPPSPPPPPPFFFQVFRSICFSLIALLIPTFKLIFQRRFQPYCKAVDQSSINLEHPFYSEPTSWWFSCASLQILVNQKHGYFATERIRGGKQKMRRLQHYQNASMERWSSWPKGKMLRWYYHNIYLSWSFTSANV